MPARSSLAIDEVGYLSYSNRHADLMFELISRRYQNKSTLITTNRSFTEWKEVFPNAACVVSLVDRLVHRAEIIVIEGEFIPRQGGARTQRTTRPTAPRGEVMSKPARSRSSMPAHLRPITVEHPRSLVPRASTRRPRSARRSAPSDLDPLRQRAAASSPARPGTPHRSGG